MRLRGYEGEGSRGESRRRWQPSAVMLEGPNCLPQQLQVLPQRLAPLRIGKCSFDLPGLGFIEGTKQIPDELLSHGCHSRFNGEQGAGNLMSFCLRDTATAPPPGIVELCQGGVEPALHSTHRDSEHIRRLPILHALVVDQEEGRPERLR